MIHGVFRPDLPSPSACTRTKPPAFVSANAAPALASALLCCQLKGQFNILTTCLTAIILMATQGGRSLLITRGSCEIEIHEVLVSVAGCFPAKVGEAHQHACTRPAGGADTVINAPVLTREKVLFISGKRGRKVHVASKWKGSLLLEQCVIMRPTDLSVCCWQV